MSESEPKFQVKDGARNLAFDGDLLAESTSQQIGRTRWVEFRLFRTARGSYILNRIGRSTVYHGPNCKLVKQYNLHKGLPDEDGVPCDLCAPSDWEDELYPEKQRHWAQVMEHPEAVLEALYKWDADGARYLTLVAQRLLSAASNVDNKIKSIYMTEYVR